MQVLFEVAQEEQRADLARARYLNRNEFTQVIGHSQQQYVDQGDEQKTTITAFQSGQAWSEWCSGREL